MNEDNIIDNIKNSPFYSFIRDSQYYTPIKMFSRAYAPKVENLAKGAIDDFIREMQAYIMKYYTGNLMQTVSIAFWISLFVLVGLALTGVISWVICLLIILLLVAVSFAVFAIYAASVSYGIDIEIKKIKSNIEKFTDSTVNTVKNLIDRI